MTRAHSAGYPTASVFSCTMNSYVMDMYRELGMRHSKVFYSFDGADGADLRTFECKVYVCRFGGL